MDEALKFSEASTGTKGNSLNAWRSPGSNSGTVYADSITPAEISEWFAKMVDERDWTPATINRYRAAMSKAFKIGIQNGKVDR